MDLRSWAALILIIVVLAHSYVTSRTVVGRHIYAVGGNPEAAELNGISVQKITFLVFGSMGLLAALAGIRYASWLRPATTIAGRGMELDAIAAAFAGAAALAGIIGDAAYEGIKALLSRPPASPPRFGRLVAVKTTLATRPGC